MENEPENHSNNEPQEDAAIQLEAIFRALPDLLFCMDSGGCILSYKAGKPSSLFLAPEQFLGKLMQDVLPPAVGGKFFQAFQNAL